MLLLKLLMLIIFLRIMLQVYHTATVHHAVPYHTATVVHHVAPYHAAPVVHAAPYSYSKVTYIFKVVISVCMYNLSHEPLD